MDLRNIIDRPIDLYNYIQSTLTPKEEEKKKFGEVFTPLSLVNEMLDKLPEKVWSNPDLKWLEPGSGLGNFSICVYLRLMDGLKKSIPNNKKRKRHILENMLYMVELNPKNVMLCRLMMGGNRWEVKNESKTGWYLEETIDYKLNLYEGDYLTFESKKDFDVNKFDVIVGNPPYQNSRGASNGTLWDRFVLYALDNLNENGLLCYVHPSGWRNVNGKFKKLQQIIFDNNLIYLEIHNEADGIKIFKTETRYDWYILQKNKNYEHTIILFEDGKKMSIIVRNLDFIPNGQFDIVNKLLAKGDEETCEVLYNRSSYGCDKKWVSKVKNDKYKYPCVYTINSQSELRLFYSYKNDGNGMNKTKLMWSNGRIKSIGSVIDKEGKYGLTQFAYAIVDKIENLENIKKAFDSHKFRKLMEYCAVCQLTVNYKIVALFKKEFWREFI